MANASSSFICFPQKSRIACRRRVDRNVGGCREFARNPRFCNARVSSFQELTNWRSPCTGRRRRTSGKQQAKLKGWRKNHGQNAGSCLRHRGQGLRRAKRKRCFELEGEGSVSVYAYAVVAKNADGTATVKQSDDPGPLGRFALDRTGSPDWRSWRPQRASRLEPQLD